MAVDIKREEANIVIVGSLNPMIFNPDWLIRHDLLPKVVMDEAKIEIIHRDIAKFSMDWLNIEVFQNRFVARTNDASYFLPLRDLVVSIFSILNETPAKQLGMNMNFDLSLPDEESWHKLGDVLAPKEIWNKVLPERVGLLFLKVESPRDDDLPGNINVTFGPSPIKEIKNGVHFNINNHIELGDDLSIQSVLEKWEFSLEEAKKISQTIIEEALL